MAQVVNDESIVDLAPDQVPQTRWEEIIIPVENTVTRGAGISAFGKPLQSTNFIQGETGWRLQSNGTAEFRAITISKTLTAGEAFDGATTPRPAFIGDGSTIVVRTADSTGTSYTMDTTKKAAFKFTGTALTAINQITFRASRDAGMTSNIIVGIQADASGEPSGTYIGSAVIPYTDITAGSENLSTSPVFATTVQLEAADYWLVAEYETTSEADQVFLDRTTGAAETTATYDGSTWTVDATSNMGLGSNLFLNAGQIWKSQANVSERDLYNGFVTSDGKPGEDIQLQVLGGIQTSGLTPGAIYYVSNALGVIGTTPGTTTIEVGTAISATELLVKAY